ncbi:DNA methyltransferase [Neobacillus niacini]|uniref:DNA-methyltransferase n=1 Tax=Neobacillus niacini TaxID=86668 RepID=UPI002FFD7581
MKLNEIYNMDCLEGMKELPDSVCSLIIADPPYKIEGGGGAGKMRSGIFHRNKGGRQLFSYLKAEQYMGEFKRLLKPSGHVYVYSNDKNLLDILYNAEKSGLKLMNVLVVNKGNKVIYGWYMKQIEFICLFRNTEGHAKQVNNNSISNLIDVKFPRGKNRTHPSEKGEDITEIMVNQSSIEGETILIPFAGSGVECLIVKRLNRNFISYELDKDFYELAIKRIN